MNNKFLYTLACASITIGLPACEKDSWGKNNDTSITAAVVTAPDDNVSIVLDPLSNAVVSFEWQAAKTGNFTPAYYKVQFDKETGDFSRPVYTGTPASLGSATRLLLSHRDMNKIAYNAGIPQLAKGKLRWRVIASNGVVADSSGVGRLVEVQRPSGFAENPVDVYLTGAATEGGTDAGKALKFKKLSDGVFELYTSLTTGTYTLVDKTTGTPVSFVLENTLIKEGTNATSPAPSKKAYRINLDFNTAIAKITEIQEVGLWFAGYNTITNILSYDAAGVWKATDIAIVWSVQSWGKDERYKFRVVEKDMNGNTTNVFWSGVNKDNTRPASSSAASYFYFKSNDATQWDYTFKFEKEAIKADVLVKFQAADVYTHQVVYKQ
jgi:starch-binding outer membrane protein SusE/F